MDPVERVQSILDNLAKPLYKDDPFSFGGRRTEISWTNVDHRGLSFQAFVNRMLTYRVEYWGADPNAAIYLAKYGFTNVSKCKVRCSSCSIEVELGVFLGKLDVMRTIATRSHKPSCWWLYISSPAEYFKIPRNPQKLAKDFLIAVEDLMTFSDDLPVIPEQLVPGQFTKVVMEKLNIVDESQFLLSSIYMGLCGWVKASDLSVQCNFCQRVCGLWNFVNIRNSHLAPPSPVKTEGRVVSMLFNQIRGPEIPDKKKDNSVHANSSKSSCPSSGSDLGKENETCNEGGNEPEEMSVSHSDDYYEGNNYGHIKVIAPPTRSFFCALTRKRNAIKILCLKMRRLQWKNQKIFNTSDTEHSSIQDTDCDLEYSEESKRIWCSVSDYNSKSMLKGEIRNGSNNNEIVSYGKSTNMDRDSEIQQNGYSDEHYGEDCAAKTDDEDIECTNDQKSTVFTHKQSLDKQSVTFSNNSNPCDTLVDNVIESAKIPNLESKTSPNPPELSSDRNSKDCDSSSQVNSCQTDDVHKIDSENDVSGQGSTKNEDILAPIPKFEQNGKSSEQSEETKTEKNSRTDSSSDENAQETTVKSLADEVSDKKVDETERNNGVDIRLEELSSSEKNKCSHETEEKNYNESGNNYEEFNNEDNQLTPVICSVVGNAVMETSEDDQEQVVSSATKENEDYEGPIIVSSNTISDAEMSDIPKMEPDNKEELVDAEKPGETENVEEPEMSTCEQSAPKLNEESQDTCNAQPPHSSPPVDVLENVEEVKDHNEESSSNKRKREEDCPITERIENTKKKIKEACSEAVKNYFHPVFDHRYWCIWKVKTSDFSGVDEATKAGWQCAFDLIQRGIEQLNADKNVSYSEVQQKTIDCINTIYSMGRPG